MISKFFDIIDNIVKGLLVAIVASFIVIVFVQVIARYVFNNSLSWSEELAKTLFTEMIFIAAPLGVIEKRHIAVDILHQYMSTNAKRYLFLVINAMSFIFFCELAVSSVMLVQSNTYQKTAALQIPMYLIYSIMPLSAVLMAINVIRAGYDDFTRVYAPGKEDEK